MIASIVISSITFVSVTLSILFFPRIRIGKITIQTYWIIALLGASILLIFRLAPIKEVLSQLVSNTSINPLKIIVLFFSMTMLSVFLDETGLFRFLGAFASKRAKSNQFILFIVLFALISFLTIFTSNDVVILTFTPFICFFCKNSKINPIPYLVMEFVAANTWSLMFIIGNPTNIYLATSAGITFFEYFNVMAIPTTCAGLIELGLLLLIFMKKLKEPLQFEGEEYHIENKFFLIVGLVHLGVCLISLIISSYTPIEMWMVSLGCATSLMIFTFITCLITKKNWKYIGSTFSKLPYPLIPFFLSMFVVVVALNYQGVSEKIMSFLSHTNTIWTYGLSSFFTSNLINNIPMSILYSNICVNDVAIYSSIVGSNLGAILTPTGALAGIMFTSLVNKHDTKYTFIDFVKYGSLVSIPVIGATLLVLSFTIGF